MAQATPSLPRNNPSFYIAGAAVTLALMRARQAVKDALRRKGEKVSAHSSCEIAAMAKAYLAEHRELMVEARATVERWTLEGVFGNRRSVRFVQDRADFNGFGCANVRCRMIVGSARVSTDGQTLDAQHSALVNAGAEKVYSEKVSGAKTDRTQLARAIAALGNGDTLIVAKLDRLARSTRDLLNTLAAIAAAGATFKSLGDPWCDTTTPHGRLMLTVLGGLAEFERHLILARTSEGRRRAQQRGVRFGRKLKLTLHQQHEALARRAAGEALVDIARSYAVSHSTISRLGASW
jgi:DNA invertase Pin-like site-specific DNA recombinase